MTPTMTPAMANPPRPEESRGMHLNAILSRSD
jgi:hypothetical protein